MATPFPFTQGQVLTAAQMNAITTLPISTKTASYTAVVGDVGSRIAMNVATNNTVTINNSIFSAGDTIFISNITATGGVTTTVTAGAGVTINTSGSLVLAQYGGGTLVALSASTFTFFPAGGIGYGTATGGTAISPDPTIDGIVYRVLQFTGDGTLTVTKAGLFDVMLVAGGGSGGSRSSVDTVNAGGGGAGGLITSTVFLSANASIVIGGGGSGTPTAGFGAQGGFSTIGALTVGATVGPMAVGGGTGFGQSYDANFIRPYVSGSAGALRQSEIANTKKTEGQGNNSGAGQGSIGNGNGAGGGGGAGAVGANGTSSVGGAGGAGFDASAFRGEVANTTRYAGGGGGQRNSGSSGAGGTGGGGAGSDAGTATNGSTNTGGGGGGGNTGGNGGSGIVLVRFKV